MLVLQACVSVLGATLPLPLPSPPQPLPLPLSPGTSPYYVVLAGIHYADYAGLQLTEILPASAS